MKRNLRVYDVASRLSSQTSLPAPRATWVLQEVLPHIQRRFKVSDITRIGRPEPQIGPLGIQRLTQVKCGYLTEANYGANMTQPEKGKLYKWNGKDYEEISFEENLGQKIPITDEAFEKVKAVRKAVQTSLGMRPELSIVASAMVLKAADLPEVVEAVKEYGLRLYSGS